MKFQRELLVICKLVAVLSLCTGSHGKNNVWAAQSPRVKTMEITCNKVSENSELKIELDHESQPHRTYVVFINRTEVPLWFPAEPEPAFRPEEPLKRLTIWFGYFDEVYGQYKGQYMIPQMRLVPPSGDLRVQLTSPSLVDRLIERRLLPQVYARVATKELKGSRTRGEQPIEDYIRHSCAVHSSVIHKNAN